MRASFLASALIGTSLATAPAYAADLCTGSDCYRVVAFVDGLSQVRNDPSYSSKIDGDYGSTAAATEFNVTSPKGAQYSASASADLSTGAIHVTAAQTSAASSAGAVMSDSVKFALPDGVSTMTVGVSWTIEGTNEFIAGLSRAGLDESSTTNFLINVFNERGMNVGLDGPIIDFHFYSSSDDLGGLDQPGSHSLTLTGTFEVNANDNYQIIQKLGAFATTEYIENSNSTPTGASSKADFGNTAFFNFILPEGVSFVSSSGTLLSNPYGAGDPTTPAVPEPASWAMMMLGFAALGGMLRHRRSAVAFA